MPRVRFMVDTVHPDHGYVSEGEVLIVSRDYVLEYEKLNIAKETDDDANTSRQPQIEKPEGWGTHALPESRELEPPDAGGSDEVE